jgi:2-haloacid dehalogenase
MIQAIIFDIFGTVVDWRGSIIAEGEASGLEVDWPRFADRWRAAYVPSMNRVRTGELPWTKLDALHGMSLDQLLVEFKIPGLTEEEKDRWNRIWHRLTPWPDAIPGLIRLKRHYTIAPLSNGNVSLLTNLAKHSGLPWDLILSTELSRHYKPDPEAYLKAVELLSLAPSEVMMAAAHRGDLDAARACGLKTGFIHRPLEYGPTRQADEAAPGEYDVVASDIMDLAAQMELQ